HIARDQRQAAGRGKGLSFTHGEALVFQRAKDEPLQLLGSAGLHARGDFLGKQLEQKFRHGGPRGQDREPILLAASRDGAKAYSVHGRGAIAPSNPAHGLSVASPGMSDGQGKDRGSARADGGQPNGADALEVAPAAPRLGRDRIARPGGRRRPVRKRPAKFDDARGKRADARIRSLHPAWNTIHAKGNDSRSTGKHTSRVVTAA